MHTERQIRAPSTVSEGFTYPRRLVFNDCLQADFLFRKLWGTKYCVLHTIYVGESFYETLITSSRSSDTMLEELEQMWILLHGASQSYASDAGLQSRPMRMFLSFHYVSLSERPVRFHTKAGVV